MGCSRGPSGCWDGEIGILTPKPAPWSAKNPFIVRMKSLIRPLVYAPSSATTKPNPLVLIIKPRLGFAATF
jgi:hypothetical protein